MTTIFDDGLKSKENVPMKGQLSGTSGVVLRSLYQRSKAFTSATVKINEYNTSKVRNKHGHQKTVSSILRRCALRAKN